MKTARLCAVGAIAAFALIAGGPAAAVSSDNASCVGQLASDRATSEGRDWGEQNSNAAQLDILHPFGQTSVSRVAQADRDACPPVP
jgi:hypothetical protein